MVDTYPNKAAILKGTGSSGSGAPGGGGGGSGGHKQGDLGGKPSDRVAAIKNRFPNLETQ